MLDIVWITLPIYLLIALGFVSVKTGYIAAAHVRALGQFALRVCLPALIFNGVAVPRDSSVFDWWFMAAYAAGSLAALGIGVLTMRRGFGQTPAASWILALGMAQSNSAFMGFPIAGLVFGDTATTVFAWILVVENAVMIPLAVVAAEAASGEAGSLAQSARRTFAAFLRNPLVIAIIVAIGIRTLGIPLPEPVTVTLGMLAAVAPAVALFIVGGIIAQFPVSMHWRRTAAISAGKLILHPCLVFAALSVMPGIAPEILAAGVLFAGVPMLSIFPILGQPHGVEQVCATALITSTAGSFVTVSAVIWLLTTA